MNIYNSRQWIEDLDHIIDSFPWMKAYAGKSVMITGIGGLVCSAVADLLIRYNETHEEPVTVVAAARSRERIRERFGIYFDRPYFHFTQYDATKPELSIPCAVDYIIHGAGNSSPDRITKEPVETMLSNITGLYELLQYSRENHVTRLLYISSSEVYGKKQDSLPFREDQYGYIDILDARNSYSVGKSAAETLCVSFADEYGTDSVIIRPGHIYGPAVTKYDLHVSSKWARDAAGGRDIVMKSDGSQIRSYCYCLDSAAAILTVLLQGENCRAYNISNPDSIISIREMAEILAKSGGVRLESELPTEEERKSFNPMSNSSLDSGSLLALGWHGCFDAETGFDHTVRILREMHSL